MIKLRPFTSSQGTLINSTFDYVLIVRPSVILFKEIHFIAGKEFKKNPHSRAFCDQHSGRKAVIVIVHTLMIQWGVLRVWLQ
jgi:hypothetical protein